jgi:hypothetical protein
LEKMARKLVSRQCTQRLDITVLGACRGADRVPKLVDT